MMLCIKRKKPGETGYALHSPALFLPLFFLLINGIAVFLLFYLLFSFRFALQEKKGQVYLFLKLPSQTVSLRKY